MLKSPTQTTAAKLLTDGDLAFTIPDPAAQPLYRAEQRSGTQRPAPEASASRRAAAIEVQLEIGIVGRTGGYAQSDLPSRPKATTKCKRSKLKRRKDCEANRRTKAVGRRVQRFAGNKPQWGTPINPRTHSRLEPTLRATSTIQAFIDVRI